MDFANLENKNIGGITWNYQDTQPQSRIQNAELTEIKVKDDFSPIGHDNVERLNASLEQAKKFSTGNNQDKLVTVLILANHVEYLTKDMLKNLRRMVRISAHSAYNGIILWPAKEFVNSKKKNIEKLMLGEIMEELKQFNFPDKDDFLICLEQFNQKRVPLIHKLLEKGLVENLKIEEILNIFNNIFLRYKTISNEFRAKWPIKK